MNTSKLTVAIGLALVGVATMVFLPALAAEKPKPPQDVQRAAGVTSAAPSPAKPVQAEPVAVPGASASLAESDAAIEAQEESARRRYANLAEGFPAAEKVWRDGVRGRIDRVQKVVAEHKPAHKPAPQSQPALTQKNSAATQPKTVARSGSKVKAAAPASQPKHVPLTIVPTIGGMGGVIGGGQTRSLAQRCRRAADQLRALADELDCRSSADGQVVVRSEVVR